MSYVVRFSDPNKVPQKPFEILRLKSFEFLEQTLATALANSLQEQNDTSANCVVPVTPDCSSDQDSVSLGYAAYHIFNMLTERLE